jgi:hypothetical protein
MKRVAIRLTGDEYALKQTIREMEQYFGSRIHFTSMPHILHSDEWICSGLVDAVPAPASGDTPHTPEVPIMPDTPHFAIHERVRVRSTGEVGIVVEIKTATTALNRTDRRWRYLVQFADSRQSSYLHEALERLEARRAPASTTREEGQAVAEKRTTRYN